MNLLTNAIPSTSLPKWKTADLLNNDNSAATTHCTT